MTAGNTAVKVTAKAALKEHWTKVIAVCCVYLFAHFICLISASLLSLPFGDTVFYISFAFMVAFMVA